MEGFSGCDCLISFEWVFMYCSDVSVWVMAMACVGVGGWLSWDEFLII